MNITYRPAEAADAHAIVPRLRRRELDALREVGDPVATVLEGLQCSIASYAALADGEVAVLWGLRTASLLDDRVYLWMLGSTVIDAHPVHFLRHSRRAMAQMRQRYRMVYGEVACDFEHSIRWLTWLGAKVAPGPAPERLVFAL